MTTGHELLFLVSTKRTRDAPTQTGNSKLNLTKNSTTSSTKRQPIITLNLVILSLLVAKELILCKGDSAGAFSH